MKSLDGRELNHTEESQQSRPPTTYQKGHFREKERKNATQCVSGHVNVHRTSQECYDRALVCSIIMLNTHHLEFSDSLAAKFLSREMYEVACVFHSHFPRKPCEVEVGKAMSVSETGNHGRHCLESCLSWL